MVATKVTKIWTKTDPTSCKKEAKAKADQKTRLWEFTHAKEVSVSKLRMCRCAVKKKVARLLSFSQSLIAVRTKSIVHQRLLICIVKAQAKHKSTDACKNSSVHARMVKLATQQLTL